MHSSGDQQPATASADQSATVRESRWSVLFYPVDIAFLVAFRIATGSVLLWYVGSYLVYKVEETPWISYYFSDPPVHFTYFGFGWARPWPGDGMYIHFAVLVAAAVGILLGFCYRFSTFVFFLGVTHVFLIEKAHYQNHYYLVCLMSLLLWFCPAHRAFSIDALLRPKIRSSVTPAWVLWLLRFQIGLPYFYGGLAKLNSDWLAGQPMRIWLARKIDEPIIGEYFIQEWVVQFFSFGGLIFDLAIVPLLLWRPTRWFGYVLVLAFNLTNAVMWDIDIFPPFMIAATLIFFSPDWPRQLLNIFRRSSPVPSGRLEVLSRRQACGLALLAVYVAVQLVFPWRHLLYPGKASWTEEGHHFAWHMMLRDKVVALRIYADYPATGRSEIVDVKRYLNHRQLSRVGKDADMILIFAHFLAEELRTASEPEVEIRALALVSLNGRKPQALFDPSVNLSAVERTWTAQPLIAPLTEPLRKQKWDAPLEQWEEILGIETPLKNGGPSAVGARSEE